MIAKSGEPDSDDPRSRSRSKSPQQKKSKINEIQDFVKSPNLQSKTKFDILDRNRLITIPEVVSNKENSENN
jgi:hypothetical protein